MEASLSSYLERVSQLPKLSESEERALARRFREHGDEEARNQLVQSQLRFVLTIAGRYRRAGVLFADLVAEGNLGLIHAANKFDPDHGCRFVTYAKHWIRVYVSECASQSSGALQKSRVLRRARRELTRATNLVGEGAPARGLMADRMCRSAGQIDHLLCLLEQRLVSFDCGVPERWSSDDALVSRDASPEQWIIDRDEQHGRLQAIGVALCTLNARERRIVAERLMVDAEAMLTLKELGVEFGISRERVRQLERRVKQKLSGQLGPLSDAERAVCVQAA